MSSSVLPILSLDTLLSGALNALRDAEVASPTPLSHLDRLLITEPWVGPLRQSCREHGFFYLVDHGVDEGLQQALEATSHAFFSLPEPEKMRIAMSLGGTAWRGFFPVGDELTSGLPDQKEGIYFGEELPETDPRVRAREPLCGPNLFPDRPANLRPLVLSYMQAVTRLGHRVLSLLAMSLGLTPDFFEQHYTREPLILFRIFHYPPLPAEALATGAPPVWSVGEHTDYGLLTLLKQDDCGGLQVKTPGGWIEAPPVPNSFVCNIGDMLDLMTGGFYRSTPHRVLNRSGKERLSFPLFFDPNMAARMSALELQAVRAFEQVQRNKSGVPASDVTTASPFEPAPLETGPTRWDHQNVHAFEGPYGDWVRSKVAKVFPHLWQQVGQPLT